jgi:octaprenyl-diphosphate synthase
MQLLKNGSSLNKNFAGTWHRFWPRVETSGVRPFEDKEWMPAALDKVGTIIRQSLQTVIVNEGYEFTDLYFSSGKMLRPQFLLRCFQVSKRPLDHRVLTMAAVVEMAHLATLCHDDALDSSVLRRNLPSLFMKMGTRGSILAGDYVLCRALNLVAGHGDMNLLKIFADSLGFVFEGEFLQNQLRNTLEISTRCYLKIVDQKTGALFGAACRMGAYLGGTDRQTTAILSECGQVVGTSYQIIDDYLDYISPTSVLGKPAGSDFREGTATLPLLSVWRDCSPNERQFLAEAFGKKSRGTKIHKRVVGILRKAGGFAKTRQKIELYRERALVLVRSLGPEYSRSGLEEIIRTCLWNRVDDCANEVV